MSEPVDLTSRVLEEIRDELRAQREDLRNVHHELRHQSEEMRGLRGDIRANSEQLHLQNMRMELVEATLRDAAGQILMMGRGLKAALSARARDDARLEDHEQRLRLIEARLAEG